MIENKKRFWKLYRRGHVPNPLVLPLRVERGRQQQPRRQRRRRGRAPRHGDAGGAEAEAGAQEAALVLRDGGGDAQLSFDV